MTDDQLLQRIEFNPDVMVGKPVISGTRMTVQHILNLLAHGTSVEDILDEYDELERDDVRACLLFAAEAMDDIVFVPRVRPDV